MLTIADSPTTFLFVRHAKTMWNQEQRYAGHSEVPLSPEADGQILHLTHLLADQPISAIYTSPLQRCIATITPIAEILEINPIIHPDLVERNLGSWEGKSTLELQAQYPDFHYPESAYQGKLTVPGAESLEHITIRLRHFFNDVLPSNKGKTVLVATHAGVIWVLLSRFVSNHRPLAWPANSEIHRVIVHGNDFILQ